MRRDAVVVDASVLVAGVMNTGAYGDWARGVTAEKHLLAPQLAPIEAGNVLRRAELARRISSPEATAGFQEIVNLPIDLLNFEPFAPRIWELRLNLTTYDAWYVAAPRPWPYRWRHSTPASAGHPAPRADSWCPTTAQPEGACPEHRPRFAGSPTC